MDFDSYSLLFLILLFAVAFLYSSVGHGGASGYLALMGIFSVAPATMKPAALLMNVFVSAIAFIQYSRTTPLNKKLFLLLIIGSVPAAFFGAKISLDVSVYKKILGVLLLFPVLRLLGFFGKEKETLKEYNVALAVLIGIGVGLISGMIGIGGGIILSPILILLGWTNIKQAAVIAAPFIFLNSISGLISLSMKGFNLETQVYLWIAIAIAGGMLGSWYGSSKLQNDLLKKFLAAVMLIAIIKLFIQ
jgi:uncharacterized membrane protein YfcA